MKYRLEESISEIIQSIRNSSTSIVGTIQVPIEAIILTGEWSKNSKSAGCVSQYFIRGKIQGLS